MVLLSPWFGRVLPLQPCCRLHLVEILVNRNELSMPLTITLDQAKRFGVFARKAVLDGRGSELIDLAETNLLR